MDELFASGKEKKGVNVVFIGGVAIALAIVAGAIWMLSSKPSIEQQTAKILEGTFRDGSPEFTALTKDILISTDDETVESPMGLGTISMFIKGRIYNKGAKMITTLEVNVGVVTEKNEVLREKKILVVPIQQPVLNAGDTIPITLTLDGFDRKDDRANIRWKVTAIRAE
ncbi:MAG: hypothetical protein ACKVQW_04330 [Pyrinomonadaceae bacterium]